MKIIVSIVDADGKSTLTEPVTFKPEPPKTCGDIVDELKAANHGMGRLLDEDGDTVTRSEVVKAGNYTYRVTGASSARGGEGQGSGAGTAGLAGTQPITIMIYDPHETPDTTTATFRNAQKFEKFLDRGNITFLYKDGCSPGINDYCDLVPGATYTTAVRSIPARVKNLEQHKEHLVRRREHEFTCAMLDDLASKGVHAVELPEERVVKAGGADEAEVDVVISHTVPGCVGAVSFVGGPGCEGAACFVRRGFVIGSTKTHVSGDSDARNLGKKIQRQYAQRPPFAGHPIQPAFMPENVRSAHQAGEHLQGKGRLAVWPLWPQHQQSAAVGSSIRQAGLRLKCISPGRMVNRGVSQGCSVKC